LFYLLNKQVEIQLNKIKLNFIKFEIKIKNLKREKYLKYKKENTLR